MGERKLGINQADLCRDDSSVQHSSRFGTSTHSDSVQAARGTIKMAARTRERKQLCNLSEIRTDNIQH